METNNFFKIYFVFNRNSILEGKWWQICHFWVKYPFNSNLRLKKQSGFEWLGIDTSRSAAIDLMLSSGLR